MTGRPPPLTPTDVHVLRAVNRFRFLTAGQLNRVLWPGNIKDRNRYAQLRLKRLTRDEYVLPLRDLPRPATGSYPRVYTLGWRGRKALRALGDRVPTYYRPSELTEAPRLGAFMPHTLAVIDVLIAAQRLTETEGIPVGFDSLLLDRDLRQLSLTATLPPVNAWAQFRRVTVVPDALFTLSAGTDLRHYILEVDRATERQRKWQDKVAGLACWLGSPASDSQLPGEDLTIMVMAPTPKRRDMLRAWTQEELHSRGLFDEHGPLFVFSAASPVTLSPLAFFATPHWYPVARDTPDRLLDLAK